MPAYWEFVQQYVDAALDHANGEIRAEDVYKQLLAEKMFLFVVGRPLLCGAATCEVVQYAQKRVIRVVTLGGADFEDWKAQLHKSLTEWAKRIDADGIEAYVRKGMAKVLNELGYRQIYIGVYWDGKV